MASGDSLGSIRSPLLPSIASLKVLRTKGCRSSGPEADDRIRLNPVFHSSRPQRGELEGCETQQKPGQLLSRSDCRHPVAEALPSLPETAGVNCCVRLRSNSERRLRYLGWRRLTSRMSNLRRWTSIVSSISPPTRWSLVKSKGLPRLRPNLRSFSRFLQSPQKATTACAVGADVALLKMNADFVLLSACNTAAGEKAVWRRCQVWHAHFSMQRRKITARVELGGRQRKYSSAYDQII